MMRLVVVADLICAGRAVLRAAPVNRVEVAGQVLDNADTADRFRLSHGMCHPRFGDGTLAAAARLSGLAPEPAICDPQFAKVLIVVLEALVSKASAD